MSYLHPFGCLVWYKLPKADRRKLDPKACLSVLLTFLPEWKGYRLWDIQRWVVINIQDVIFNDSKIPYGDPIRPTSDPISVELPWPTHPASTPAFLTPPPEHIPTPDLPPLDIQLKPCFDRRLQASIHNTQGSSPIPDGTVSPTSYPSRTPTTAPVPPPTPSAPAPTVGPAPPRRSSRFTRNPDRLENLQRKLRYRMS